jgi:dTDP-glucose 4,6-dehydratase
MRVLLTGGAGFIGHHVAEHLLRKTDHEVVFLDRLDLSGNLNRIVEIEGWNTHRARCKWVFHDLRASLLSVCKQIGKIDVVLHLAASTHVDRSIVDPLTFVYDNVVGTANLLEFGRSQDGLHSFCYFSTDEVFGPAPPGVAYKEWDRYKSGNPYSATQAGGEELCRA